MACWPWVEGRPGVVVEAGIGEQEAGEVSRSGGTGV
jgi:hypothetical protein